MATVNCPECDRGIGLGRRLRLGQRFLCPHCRTAIEVISEVPLELDWVYDDDDEGSEGSLEDVWSRKMEAMRSGSWCSLVESKQAPSEGRGRRMEIPMKAKVQCTDGAGVQPTMLLVDPTNNRITHLVVKERQPPQAERLVPIRCVRDTTGEVIRLRCSLHDLSEMRPLVMTEFVRAEMPDLDDGPRQCADVPYLVPKWVKVKHKSIPRGELGVRRGVRVMATDREVGRAGEFVIDPASGNITHLVLR